MVIASLLLHGVAICTVLVISARWMAPAKPVEIRVAPVKLVQATARELRAPVPEKEVKPPSTEQGWPVEQAGSPSTAALEKASVETRTLGKRSKAQIKPAKRTREPKRVEVPREVPDKKPEKEQKPDKKDQEKQVEQSLAAIREKLSHQAAGPSANAEDKSPRTNSHTEDSESAPDQELTRWVEEVKQRVNSSWTVTGFSNVGEDKSTLIGVTLTPDGQFKTATVDKSSGDEVYDGSAMRAVQQATPFPQLSREAVERITSEGGLAIMFTPTGIR